MTRQQVLKVNSEFIPANDPGVMIGVKQGMKAGRFQNAGLIVQVLIQVLRLQLWVTQAICR